MGIKGPRSIYGTLGNLNFVRLRRRLLVWTLTGEWELPSDFYELRNWSEISELVVQPRDSLTRHCRDKQRQTAVTHPNPDRACSTPVVFRISFPFCRHSFTHCLVPFVPPYFNSENLQHPQQALALNSSSNPGLVNPRPSPEQSENSIN